MKAFFNYCGDSNNIVTFLVQLVEAFHATLEEVVEADMLVVCIINLSPIHFLLAFIG
jgi:hypothetical protein